MSTAERALIDIAQDRRYWIIHSITIPSLFVGGVIFMLSGFVYKLFGALNFNKYFDKDNSSISLINYLLIFIDFEKWVPDRVPISPKGIRGPAGARKEK